MKTNVQNRLEQIRKNGYELDFSKVFEHTFENYKKIALYGGLIIFVGVILFSIITFATLIGIFGAPAITEYLKPENLNLENLSLNTLLIISGISVLISALLSPLIAGLIKMAYCAENDEEFHVSTMFGFYKAPYFSELFIATFLFSLVSNAIGIVTMYFKIPFLSSIISILIALLTIMMIPLIIFGKLKALEAINASFLIVSKQPWVLLGLLVVCSIGVLVGFIGCCVGIFFTYPVLSSLHYAIYSEIIGFETETELQEKS
ncbi:hypothetical protein [Flavobacterium sp. GP15]|uniref:hypothetical protein n=1 Tax=Flavobacterium sp. GP15 TaxID=2758567 RepID=UPI00165D81A9|nr:hypothetical protein [Flavobacterium sp. GP15]